MIQILRKFNSAEEATRVKCNYHEALKGSPAYINSEIAILDGDSDNEFILIVGNHNSNDIYEMLEGVSIARKTNHFSE